MRGSWCSTGGRARSIATRASDRTPSGRRSIGASAIACKTKSVTVRRAWWPPTGCRRRHVGKAMFKPRGTRRRPAGFGRCWRVVGAPRCAPIWIVSWCAALCPTERRRSRSRQRRCAWNGSASRSGGQASEGLRHCRLVTSTFRFLPVFPDSDVDGQRNLQNRRRLHSVAHDRGESLGPVLGHFEQQLVVNRENHSRVG